MFTKKPHPSVNTGVQKGNHAIVVGGSMAGLLAAKMLLTHFNHVTVVERDVLPQQPEWRRGVPQANHGHVLLLRGEQILEELFPGIGKDLVESGVPEIDWGTECTWLTMWGWLPRSQSGFKTHLCSRVRLEWTVRQRLMAEPNLTILEGCNVDRLLINEQGSRVTGIVIRQTNQARNQNSDHHQPETLMSDFVVDASGRNSLLPQWLENLGYAKPSETIINSFLGYATRWYERPGNESWKMMAIALKPPVEKRSGMLIAMEDNRWVLTLSGIGDYPPTDEEGFLEFARSLRNPMIYEAIKDAKPISPIYGYRRTENCWRHYESLSRFPEGIVALGDAVCAFNPVYAQGMTTAALSVKLLDQCLHKYYSRSYYSHNHHLHNPKSKTSRFSHRYQTQLASLLKMPWLMATSEDFRWDSTVGGKPGLFTRLMHRYMDQVAKLALVDLDSYSTFVEVIHMLKPPSALMHPKITARVLGLVLQRVLVVVRSPKMAWEMRSDTPH